MAVVIRSVWAHNFVPEFNLVRSLLGRYPYVSLDTEFPGILFDGRNKPYYRRTAEEQYALVKANVDVLHVIQLGLTLFDADGRYMMKAITGRKLPETVKEFMEEVKRIFGDVYDVKSVIRGCNGLYGGLEQVAKMLHVERAAGRSHQAGSDSHLVGLTFLKLRQLYFSDSTADMAKRHAGRLYGLD